MDGNVLKAILALDSYNRGYGQSIIMTGSTLGQVKILSDSFLLGTKTVDTKEVRNDVASGFFGIAYQLANGDKTISYRGTDDIAGDGEIGNDIWNGFLTGAGLESKQAELALKFYEIVKSSYGDNISLTGHSLGGGLAGLVGALNNKTGVLFDNMSFEQAATLMITNLNKLPNDPVSIALKLIIPNFATSILDTSKLQTHYMQGEFLTAIRAGQLTSKIGYSLGDNITIPGIDNGVTGGGLQA